MFSRTRVFSADGTRARQQHLPPHPGCLPPYLTAESSHRPCVISFWVSLLLKDETALQNRLGADWEQTLLACTDSPLCYFQSSSWRFQLVFLVELNLHSLAQELSREGARTVDSHGMRTSSSHHFFLCLEKPSQGGHLVFDLIFKPRISQGRSGPFPGVTPSPAFCLL